MNILGALDDAFMGHSNFQGFPNQEASTTLLGFLRYLYLICPSGGHPWSGLAAHLVSAMERK